MSSFSVGATSVTFLALQEGYSSKAGVLEEKRVNVIIDNATDWGALFSIVTPHDVVSVRSCRGSAGVMTTKVDIGGGAGAGTLVLDNVGSWTAVLIDLNDDAPEVGALTRRIASATWLILA